MLGSLKLEGGGAGGTFSSLSTARIDGGPQELRSYRQRIDASVEQQKEQADLMAELQRKVIEYRRRFAELEGQLASKRLTDVTMVKGIDLPELKVKDEAVWETKALRNFDDAMQVQLVNALNEERRRIEEYRSQLEQERLQNQNMQAEMQRLRQQYEFNMMNQEKLFRNREKNLGRHLSEEQKKMMDLWVELQQVRKQCADFKEQTERDLENQKNEFLKVVNNVSTVSRHVTVEDSVRSLVKSEDDMVLLDVAKRFREQGGAFEDNDLYNDLLRKYEKAVERIIELESHSEDDSKIALLELELKRARDTITDHLSTFQKIYEMAKDSDRSGSKSQPRTRSQSPGSVGVTPPETLRSVRLALRNLDSDNNALLKKLKNAEIQIEELNSKYEASNTLRQRLDKQLTMSKQEIAKQLKALDNAARDVKRLEANIQAVEEERDVAEVARKRLEDEVRRLNELLGQTQPKIDVEALQSADDKSRLQQKDFEKRISDLTRRVDVLVDENRRLKIGTSDFNERYKSLENEHADLQRKLDDKDATVRQLEVVKKALGKDLENTRARLTALSKEADGLRKDVDAAKRTTGSVDITIKQLKVEKDEINIQKDDFYRQVVDLRQRLDDEVKQRGDIEKTNRHLLGELDKIRNQLKDYEETTLEIRRHNEQLDTQDKVGQTRVVALETKLRVLEKQLESLGETNDQLRAEKQDIVNLKGRLDVELGELREQLRKAEQEVDKYKRRNTELADTERRAAEKVKLLTDKIYLLEKELEEANNEIDELKGRLQKIERDQEDRLEYTIKLKTAAPDVPTEKQKETVETREITEIRLRDSEKWKDDADRLEGEKESLLLRLRTVEDDLADKKIRIEDLVKDLARVRDEEDRRRRLDMENLERKYQNDLDDEKDLYSKNLDSAKALEDELRTRLASIEQKYELSRVRETELEKEAADWQDKWNAVIVELQKAREDMDAGFSESSKEIQRWKSDAFEARSDLKLLESTVDSLRTQLTSATDRCASLNKTVIDQESRIRDLEGQVARLEDDLADAKSLVQQHEGDLDSTVSKLRALESQYSQLQLDSRQLRNDIEALQRDNDLLRSTNTSYENEIDDLKRRLEQANAKLNEYDQLLEEIRKERDGLQNVFHTKKIQVEQLTQLSQTFDDRLIRAKQDAVDTAEKLFAADAERNAQRAEIIRLQQELQLYKQQIVDKNNEYHLAINEITDAHREAEDGRLNAIRDLDSRRYEIDDLQSRLNITEQRLTSLQKEYQNADAERDALIEALRRLHALSMRGIIASRLEKILAGKEGETVLEPTEGQPETVEVESVKFTKSGITDDHPDVQETYTNVQNIITRLDQAERERAELRAALARMKRKTSDSTLSLSKQETRFQTIEERYTYVEEERRSVEARLSSAKRLLRSQEEALKQRDDERKQLKAKMATIELESRTRDAQNRHLNDTIRNLKAEVEKAQSEMRSLRDREVYREVSKTQAAPRDDGDSKRISLLVANFDSERQNLNDSLKKVTSQLQFSEGKVADLNDEVDRLRRDLAKAENIEADLRRTIDQHARVSYEIRALKDQLSSSQNELSSALNRKQQVEAELASLRSDLRDQRQRLHDSSNRVADLQRQLQDSQNDKNRLNDRILSLEKTISTQRTTENDLRQQLSNAVGDTKSLQRDLDDLQRRFTKSESDRQSLADKVDEHGRIRLALQKKIEILEGEKRSIEALIAETAAQREGIEHSLSALERENKELYRNCASLQQQIAQLEMDNGDRIVKLTMKQKDDHDRYVQAVSSEKVHIEKLVETRERALKNQVKQLEGQLSRLRDQLDAERRHRRSLADQFLVTDFPKSVGKSTTYRSYTDYTDAPYSVLSPFESMSTSPYGLYGTSATSRGYTSTVTTKADADRSDGFKSSVQMPGGAASSGTKEESGKIALKEPKVELDESGLLSADRFSSTGPIDDDPDDQAVFRNDKQKGRKKR